MNQQHDISLPYSVLMPVHAGADAGYFREALYSMINQTLPPDEIVLACDGPLSDALEEEIKAAQEANVGLIKTARLPEHRGVGLCCNAGLEACANDIVVRMDADDISEPDRCRIELEQFAKDPSLDIVSGYIMEFENDDPTKGFVRTVPTDYDEVMRYARRRNPFSNVTIAYRRSTVLACGGYRDLSRAEDYDLACRMLQKGARFVTLPTLMVRVRTDADGFRRRKSFEHIKSLISVRWGLYKMGFTSFVDFFVMSCSHLATFFMPAALLRYLYQKKLRVPSGEQEK